MKIVALVHMYPPAHNAGAEWMLHSLLRAMVARGHEATVIVPEASVHELDGVRVLVPPRMHDTSAAAAFARGDVAVTHLDYTRQAVVWSSSYGVPLAHLVHNDRQLAVNAVANPDLVVYNSRWLSRAVGVPGIVCHPPVDCEAVTARGAADAITLINLSPDKGAHVLEHLARRFPERRFIGVLGAYGPQMPPRLPNVEVWPQTPRIAEVYAETRLLLVPSVYESFGRVAVEACCNGIPVIAHPTPGLRESLAGAGTYADRNDLEAWAFYVRGFDDEARYAAASSAALVRARQLDPEPVYARFERHLERIRKR